MGSTGGSIGNTAEAWLGMDAVQVTAPWGATQPPAVIGPAPTVLRSSWEMARTSEPEATGRFADLGLAPPLVSVLDELGYEEPTPIQRDAIPPLLAGRDLVGQAATGTGKTAAFALPLLQRSFGDGRKGEGPALLVLVPTRELAMQVAEAIHRYGRKLGVRVLPVYGGQSLGVQLQALRRGVDVVVATPGRALDHLRRGTLALGRVRAVVLDEADEMLDMGFAEDLEAILGTLPKERQTALFSATMPTRIMSIAQRHLDDPVRLAIAEEKTPRGEAPRVRQVAYLVSRAQKVDALGRILDLESPASALVFCRTRNEVEELARKLNGRGYRAEALHGGMSQRDRDRVMGRFREGAAELLLATDVAARGLDIGRLSHVINYDVPPAPESYVHRIGRTGRAGREGVAITLAEPRERPLLRNIEKLTRRPLEMATVPTVADLRARRLEVTRASLREAVVAGGNEGFRVVVESLAEEFDVLDLAAAAVRVAFEATERPEGAPPAAAETATPPRTPRAAGDFTRLYVSVGRAAEVRPGDLVGAITGEAGLQGGDIGAIEIADRHSLVEVREDRAEDVLKALRGTTIRGRPVTASRYRPPARDGRAAPRSAPRPTSTRRRTSSPARPRR
jgi:ATP-dependent RNA helicase DeaD